MEVTLQDGIIDAKKIELSGNTYIKNFVSNNEAIVDLRGVLFVSMRDETFKDNGENIGDLLSDYSQYSLSSRVPQSERQTIWL